jgi:membrane protease subunit HflC
MNSSRSRPLWRVAMFLLPLVAVPLVVALAWSSLVFVDEGEYVIVERFGEIVAVYDRPADRGLKFKLPWPVDVVRRFDRRVRLYEPPGREVFTADKKNLTVAAFVCWKIAEPREEASEVGERPVVRFFRNLASPAVAEARLDSRVRSLLNTELGRIQLSKLLAVNDSHAGPQTDDRGLLARIADDVRKRLQEGRNGKPALTDELGIEIVDLRIRRINFPVGNRQAVYDRMRSERKKEADQYRSAGLSESKAIRSRADLQYERVLSSARADSERIRGTAEAEAIAIRNAAHAKDPEFYVTLRTLETYKKILNEKTTLVLSASSSLLKMLTDGIPRKAPMPERKKDVKSTTGLETP